MQADAPPRILTPPLALLRARTHKANAAAPDSPAPALMRARWHKALAHAAERGREHAAEVESVAQQQVSSSHRLLVQLHS